MDQKSEVGDVLCLTSLANSGKPAGEGAHFPHSESINKNRGNADEGRRLA